MSKIWKSIESIDYKDCGDCIKDFKNKNYKLSPWIENIVKNKNFKFSNYDFPIQLIRKNVKDIGFEGPTELEKIYNKVAPIVDDIKTIVIPHHGPKTKPANNNKGIAKPKSNIQAMENAKKIIVKIKKLLRRYSKIISLLDLIKS